MEGAVAGLEDRLQEAEYEVKRLRGERRNLREQMLAVKWQLVLVSLVQIVGTILERTHFFNAGIQTCRWTGTQSGPDPCTCNTIHGYAFLCGVKKRPAIIL